MHQKVALAAAMSLLAGCSSAGRLDSGAAAPDKSEAVFVMGVAPENYRISVFPGSVQNGKFHQDKFRSAAVYAAAKDGYVVGKAKAGDTVAITNVRYVSESSALFVGTNFVPCDEAKTVVFEVPQGGVYYLLDLEYLFRGQKLEVNYSEKLNAAQTYVDANFPALKGLLQQAKYQFLSNDKSCAGGTTYIPIYLPRR